MARPRKPPAKTENSTANGTVDLKGVARKTIGEVINETITPERVQQLINDVLTTTRETWGSCPSCRKKVPVTVPDPAKAVQVLKELLEQAEGKPKDDASLGTTIIVKRPPR